MTRLWLLSPLLVLLTADSFAQVCSSTTFATAETFPAPNPIQVVLANFNGDGFLDIATASPGPNEIAVLLNDGSGGFGPPIVTPVPESPAQIAAADLRGNGTTDLVVAVYDGIEVLLGNGDGTFATPVFYPSNSSAGFALVVGTFDANGSPDVILANQYGQSTVFFAGHGDGTFAAAVPIAVTAYSGLAVGDFNGDSKLDLVVPNSSPGTISIYLGNGDGTFGPPANFVAGVAPVAVAVGDLDGDGHQDVAVATPGYVSVLLGNGDGTFQAALQYLAAPSPAAISIADVDLDGQEDVVVADYYENAAVLLFGTGGGALSPPSAYQFPGRSYELAVGDLNGDGLPEIVSGDYQDSVIPVLRNAGQRDLLGVPLSSLPSGPNQSSLSSQIAQGDWNGDGLQDLAWTNSAGINLIESTGGGHFAQTSTLTVNSQSPQMFGLASGDLTGDGKSDIVSADYSNVYLFAGNGDGTFAAPVTILSSPNPGAVAIADFTGDGKLDVVVAPTCCGTPLAVLPGNGDGTFRSPVFTPLALEGASLLAADLNGDGKADLIESTSGFVYVQISNGDGTFQPPVLVYTSNGCCPIPFVAVGAFTGGPLDLLVSTFTNTSVSLLPGNGDGTFGTPILVALPGSPGGISVGDFDGDGNLDFAVYTGYIGILVFPGLGNRHFQSPAVYPASSVSAALVTGMFTGGGLPDVVAAGQITSTLVNSRLGVLVPTPSPVIVGSPATLTASASGYGPVQYQWRLDGTPLADGGRYSGSTTPHLSIADAAFSDTSSSYDVVVTDSCTSATSPAVHVQVEFADVPPSNIFYADINAVAAAGIAAGCGGVDYCPTSPTTRAQMAAFLLKAEHGSAYVPPACSGVFGDVPCPSPFADWIEQLASEGVTSGCGNGDYCPDASVTRAQMAVFLLKTKNGSSYVPPTAIGIFGDVPPGSFAADWIEALYNAGITGGCSISPLLYCPNNPVNRGQMATFLTKTFNLL